MPSTMFEGRLGKRQGCIYVFGMFFSTKHHLKPVCLDVFQVSFYVDLWDDMDILSQLGIIIYPKKHIWENIPPPEV